MNKKEVLDHIHAIGVVPVLRAPSARHALAMAVAVSSGGVPVMEVTMTVPDAMHVIRTLARDLPEVLIGAGTVLDAETARQCIEEGAQFIVSPSTDLQTIEFCRRHNIAVIPGALTPTEILAAWRAGADVVKIFPVSAMGGASYLKSIKGPLPQIELMPSGGISLSTVTAYLDAGAWAIGAGNDLANTSAIERGQPELLTEAARLYREAVRQKRVGVLL
jgi:2-dehydro-3-deoxyphosphogluconate aldolase/(4S)-4-hydroxy-2-oxoglutarate aldolase